MESKPVSVTPSTDANTLQRLMLDNHCRYVPVMDDGVLLGVISFYDLAQAIVAAQKFENSMLKAYIRDWPDEKPTRAAD
jgi:CBS domain-containing protein